jgi:hypothetical protein
MVVACGRRSLLLLPLLLLPMGSTRCADTLQHEQHGRPW